MSTYESDRESLLIGENGHGPTGTELRKSLSPYEQIEAKYAQHPQEKPFGFYVEWHLRHGFVFSTPDFFIMGREVIRQTVETMGLDLRAYPRALWSPDTWYIHAMAGDMSKAWDILPYPLPWLAWERILDGKRDLRFYCAAEVKRLCNPVA